MKTNLLLTCLTISLLVSLAFSQETKKKIGLGVSLNPTALLSSSSTSTLYLPVGLTNIYVPINVAESFRLEPEAGIFTSSSESSSGSFSSKSSSSFIRLAVGLFYLSSPDNSFNSYVGPRIGVLMTSSTSQQTGNPEYKTSETDFFIGLAIGGEYLISPHFGLGGEAQLNYISFGQPDVSPAPSSPSTQSRSMFTNNALMFFRWYF